MDVQIHVVLIFGYIIGCYSARNQNQFKMMLYTDLVDMIGKNVSCLNKQDSNNSTTEEDNLYAKQGIVISNYEFHDVSSFNAVIGKCDVTDIHFRYLNKYNWTCFSTSNSTSREHPNWFFLDCQQSQIVSVQCLDAKEIRVITEHLCDKQDKDTNRTCTTFAYPDGKTAICSQAFRLKKIKIPKADVSESSIDIEDTIAYLCVAFILTTFLISVMVPANKCKPTYKYDKEQGFRVPLEIYEMYGVSYQPSAKKKRNRKSVNMDVIPAITSHMNNVAAVANNPVDWKGHKTKFNFRHGQPLFHGLGLETLDIISKSAIGKGRNDRVKDSEDSERDRNRASIVSNESVGIFDYTLFNNEDEECINSKTRRASSHAESISSVDNNTPSKQSNHHSTRDKHMEYGQENKGFVAEVDKANNKKHDKGLSVSFAQDEHNSSFQKANDPHSKSCMYGHISAIGINSDAHFNATDATVEQNRLEERTYEVIDKEDVNSGSDDTEIYGNDQSFLLPIYEDARERGPCMCNNQNTTHPTQNENYVTIATNIACKVKDLDENDRSSASSEHVDVNVSKDILRPRISITLDFPKNFGLIGEAHIEHNEVNETDDEQRKRKLEMQHNVNARNNTSNGRNPLNKSRKYSLC